MSTYVSLSHHEYELDDVDDLVDGDYAAFDAEAEACARFMRAHLQRAFMAAAGLDLVADVDPPCTDDAAA